MPGAICGAQDTNRNTAKIEYCYWRENCVRNAEDHYTTEAANENTLQRNWLVCEPSSYSKSIIQGGTFSHNGYFTSYTDGALTDGPDINGQGQHVEYGSNLLDALNAYADAVDPNHIYLKRWKVDSNYAAIFE